MGKWSNILKNTIMAKLSKQLSKRLEIVGIKAKSEEEAITKALKRLEEQEVEGYYDEDLETLVSILESFVEPQSEDAAEILKILNFPLSRFFE